MLKNRRWNWRILFLSLCKLRDTISLEQQSSFCDNKLYNPLFAPTALGSNGRQRDAVVLLWKRSGISSRESIDPVHGNPMAPVVEKKEHVMVCST
jgi:hypothetical protein